ncbi:MAG: N-acetylglucosamine kinase [Cryomorphaceae bacterium]|jgi:N-acetylglucosamine kinase-like BadF-type ATPase|nr:N-acetylglucosamine kinase [Cryomorphaceae bacterium]MBT4518046.1 N-acetylglucosamine kinase [Cryomorphaceae bacterium]MBT7384103.1 N-acetylglucosamine kinase [Cryomorphaceae bacterium]
MILVVDSGSTKTDWIALDNEGEEIFSTQTLGLNPQMLSNEILNERIKNNFDIYKNRKLVTKLFFYGAGCGVKDTQNRILKVFKSIFVNSEFDIKEDTYAAVYSAVDKGVPSIVNIIGTGSNCSYYDGKNVIQKVQSLGYVLMDYASGNYYGKYLIRAYYFNKMPEYLRDEFSNNYDLSPNSIKNKLYREENPNTYLAGFARFLIENKSNEYFKEIIFKGLERFIDYQILQYDDFSKVDIHYVGSIAYYLKDEITKIGKKYNLKTGKFIQRPITGLVDYHKRNI